MNKWVVWVGTPNGGTKTFYFTSHTKAQTAAKKHSLAGFAVAWGPAK